MPIFQAFSDTIFLALLPQYRYFVGCMEGGAMKEFLKNNPTLAFGLGLPLLLVVIFSLAAGIPSLTAVPPKYDVIFATNYYGSNEGFRIHTSSGKAVVTFVGECNYCQPPEIYRYNSANGTLKRITIDIPPEARQSNNSQPNPANKNRVIPVEVPDLSNVRLDDSNPAPDGYLFAQGDDYSSGGVLPSIFFSRSYYYNEPVLRKDNYRIRLPLAKGYYHSSNVRLIGWVIPQ
jgi:hypothetical protein